MAFSGGGSNILKNHTHDSTIIEDGGNLNMQGVTQGNMSNGSITFSDGVHLQERSIGAASDVLTVAGGVPTWAAAAAGGATCADSLTISGQTNTLCKWLELGA